MLKNAILEEKIYENFAKFCEILSTEICAGLAEVRVEAGADAAAQQRVLGRARAGLAGRELRLRELAPELLAERLDGLMTPATATGDPPFRRELSRARSRLYGYLR